MLTETSSLRFGEFTLDRRLRELRRGNAVVSIPGKAFDLLSYMASNAGRPLTKAELLDAVWPETTVEESNLSQNVFLLRKALGGSNDGPIKTLAGRGYQFAAEVAEIEPVQNPRANRSQTEQMTSLTVEATETRVVVHQDTDSPGRIYRWILAIVIILAAVSVIGWKWRQRWLDRSGGAPVQVVLLPMEGSTGDPALDKSLTQALRMDLGQSPYISVVQASTVHATLTQMMHKPSDTVTPEMAREVCERTNSQGVLSGGIAKVGQHFLITEEASNCVDGSVLGQAKYEAAKAEELPHAIDNLAASLRQELGESRRSIARFNTPLFEINTASLDALKAYSQAVSEADQGKRPEAIALFKQAVAADPNFATAYYSLATLYLGGGDNTAARAALQKAYDLRDFANQSARFNIIAFYNSQTTQDLFESERNARSWTELYPRNSQAWSSLYKAEYDLGKPEEQVTTGTQALNLRPQSQPLYVYLAMSQMHAGNVSAARATLDRAIAQNLDGDRIRNIYLPLAYLIHDPVLLKAQTDWGAAHPDSPFFLTAEAAIAMAEGRMRDARLLVTQAADVFRRQGLAGAAENVTQFEGVNLMEVGDLEEGKRIFQSVPIDTEDGYSLIGLIDAGNLAGASTALHAAQIKYPRGTLWNLYWAPFIQARIAIATHHPNDAVTLLKSPIPCERRDLSLRRVRGDAYLSAGQTKEAEKTYRDVLAHPEIDPSSGDIPFAWLGLGRAFAIDGNHAAAVDAYQHFFTLWAHADPGAKYLVQARQEFAKLQSTP
jgi:eukaryotic-like serine/threonine-protein kinase